ncbi:MAG TPA: ATP-binding protein, partial [Armatimonadota bacterium]
MARGIATGASAYTLSGFRSPAALISPRLELTALTVGLLILVVLLTGALIWVSVLLRRIRRQRAEVPARGEGEHWREDRLIALHEMGNTLVKLPTVDDICRRAVELGREKLGFDRLSIWLTTDQPDFVAGSFGIDETGALRDERQDRVSVSQDTDMGKLLADKARILIKRNSPLYDHTAKVVGQGEHALAAIWNGDTVIGCLSVDNFLSQQPFTPAQCDLLINYAATLGHLITQKQAVQERASLEEQLRQSQKMEAVGQLTGSIAHDFNNLLTPILAYADLALAQSNTEDRLAVHLHHIREAGQRAADLTRQLLAFSRKQLLNVQVLNLNDAVKDFVEMLRRVIGEDIELSLRLTQESSCVKADPAQIQQVLMNLAINARDAMPGGGMLLIETAIVSLDADYAQSHPEVQPGEFVLFSVSDTGCGMGEETLRHAFEPFFTTKELGKGTGLGLSTSYGIVKQHGGHISIYSEPDSGTTVKVYLPRVLLTPEAVEAPPVPETRLGHETVLLVEDEAVVNQLVYGILTAHG